MSRFSASFRVLGVAALVVYFLLAGIYLGLRYGVMPNIDRWRPQIEEQLSGMLDARVGLDQVSAGFYGLNPSFALRGMTFHDEQGRRVLRLPAVQAELSWRGLSAGLIRFVRLQVQGLQIDVRKDAEGHLWVLGHSFDMADDDDNDAMSLDHPLMQWLAQQQQIVLSDAAIRWRDATRTDEPLVLRSVTLNFLANDQGHRLSVTATPPVGLGRTFEVRACVKKTDASLPATDKGVWSGLLYTHIDDMTPRAWQPWMDIPGDLESGQVSAQWWLSLAKGAPDRFALDANVHDGKWRLGEDAVIRAGSAKLAAAGSWEGAERISRALTLGAAADPRDEDGLADQGRDVKAPHRHSAAHAGTKDAEASSLRFAMQAKTLELRLPEEFDFPLRFDSVKLGGSVGHRGAEGLSVDLSLAHLLNADMDLGFRGKWSQGDGGDAGTVDMSGVFARAAMNAVDEYLPKTVSLDAREWLAKGLVDGQIENAAVVLKGDLEHFPFGRAPERGDFRIAGEYKGGIIDYLPAENKQLGWPRLTGMKGKVSLHRADLRMIAEEATVWPTDSQPIRLSNVRAQIPNIESGAVLYIQGESHGSAPAYLALARTTPLQHILDDVLGQATAEGQWQVPLGLTIPLLDSLNTTVRGSIRFSDGQLALRKQAPPFENLTGVLDFTDRGVTVAGLKGRLLGGSVEFGGGLGGKRNALTLQGKISAEALANYAGVQGFKRLAGQFAYQAAVRHLPSGEIEFGLNSELRGLAINLPTPLGKEAAHAAPLTIVWIGAGAHKDSVLDIQLGTSANARLLHRDGGDKSFFRTAGVAVGLPLVLPDSGLSIDVRRPQLDLDEWEAVIDDFSEPVVPVSAGSQPVFPAIQRIRLQAELMQVKGLELEMATLAAGPTGPLQWRVDVSSTQTAGTVFWREASGKVAGRVDAKFDRLALGHNKGEAAGRDDALGEPAITQELDIPAIKLEIDKFVLYGHPVGRLLVEGVNRQRGQLWQLDTLSLDGSSARLKGSGTWRLNGAERGLELDAMAEIDNAGDYLAQIGFPDLLEGGKGTIKGKIHWRNMPWAYQRSDINGKIEIKLDKGRFSTLNSRSARILELLSLQSLRRLATLDFSPGSAFKNGFPFDRLTGTLTIDGGIMTTNNYQVTGPVATISLGGDVDLMTEKLNLQAMVVPNLDISGASVAAGIAINPIVGVGAFLAQWLLRKPLSNAMTAHYRVSGDWDDPELKDASSAPASAIESPATAAQP